MKLTLKIAMWISGLLSSAFVLGIAGAAANGDDGIVAGMFGGPLLFTTIRLWHVLEKKDA